ncbi:hypothetical protein D3C71_1940610 [compost metagenome]
MIVRRRDVTVEIESVTCVEDQYGAEWSGWYNITGIRLKADGTPDRRKWSNREHILVTPKLPIEIIK